MIEALASRSLTGNVYSCSRKAVHYWPEDATRQAYALEQRFAGERFEPYGCLNCGFYHVGHAEHWFWTWYVGFFGGLE